MWHFENTSATPQSVNWGVNGQVVDGDPRAQLESGIAEQKPVSRMAQPPPFVGSGYGVENNLAPYRIRNGRLYEDKGDGEAAWLAKYGAADNVIIADGLPECKEISKVFLISPLRHEIDIDDCIKGQLGLSWKGQKPGQVFQV